MARRRGRTAFVRPPKKTMIWIGSGVGITTIVALSLTLVSSLSAGALLLRPFTILRTRMEILFRSDQEAVDEDPFGDYGKIVVTDAAAAIGSTAIPDPSSSDGDPDADWFVHQPVIDAFTFVSSAGFAEPVGTRYTIDSKAMRKVGINDNVVSMFSEVGNHGAFFYTLGRMLIQLH